MESLKNKSMAVGRLAKDIAVCMIVFHLILMALGVNGQPRRYEATGSPNSTATVSSQASKVRTIYTSQIGIREKQANSGRDVEKYLSYVNLPKGNPWCAAFVCWVFGQAGVSNPRTGWSPALFPVGKVIWISGDSKTRSQEPGISQNAVNNFQESEFRRPARLTLQRTTGSRQPTRGDVFGLYFPEKGRIAHVGFVDDWGDTWVTTVEGNTNVLGSREGDGVYRKRRLVRSIYNVSRYVD